MPAVATASNHQKCGVRVRAEEPVLRPIRSNYQKIQFSGLAIGNPGAQRDADICRKVSLYSAQQPCRQRSWSYPAKDTIRHLVRTASLQKWESIIDVISAGEAPDLQHMIRKAARWQTCACRHVHACMLTRFHLKPNSVGEGAPSPG